MIVNVLKHCITLFIDTRSISLRSQVERRAAHPPLISITQALSARGTPRATRRLSCQMPHYNIIYVYYTVSMYFFELFLILNDTRH